MKEAFFDKAETEWSKVSPPRKEEAPSRMEAMIRFACSVIMPSTELVDLGSVRDATLSFETKRASPMRERGE